MAMTKAEQKRMEDLEQALRLARSLRWPDYPAPASMTADDIKAALVDGGIKWGRPERVARGWFFNAYDRGSVSHGCSNGVTHDRSNPNNTSTQQCGTMYRTELDALRMLRIQKTEDCAKILADIDRRIEALLP